MEDSSNLLRVLIATDNHLGVWEKDEVRKDDSFRAFEEILQMASDMKVDFVLLGGDLFHDNKPSRSTVLKAVRLCKKYCLNDNPIQFQILSDRTSSFVEGCVNFEDPNLNVGLPIFTIHGNHDDPSGQDNSSAVEQLSSAGLLNYFGKVPLSGSNIGRITLAPILIQKGDTRLALYGLGNIREERLGRLFQTPGCVQWLKPAATEEITPDDWLNVFVVHQNRVQHGALAKSCLQERYIPNFVDLVIWGHEHECKADPQALLSSDIKFEKDRNGFVIQPGSSVATALSEGEAKKKHVVLLEVKQEKWRTIKYPLETVRPFMYANTVLKDQASLEQGDQEAVNTILENKVQSMIDAVKLEHPTPADAKPILPLIRLRVDYTGFSTINSQRFGQKFVNKVANPHDILLWTKAAVRRKAGAGDDDDNAELTRPEALDQSRIEDLIAQHLPSMDILPHDELSLALHNYVEKDEKDAIATCVHTVLVETQRQVAGQAGNDEVKDDELDTLLQSSIQHLKTIKSSGTPSRQTLDSTMLPTSSVPSSIRPRDVDDMDVDIEVGGATGGAGDDGLPPTGRGRGRGKGRGRQAAGASVADGSGTRGRGRGRGRAASSSQGSLRQTGISELFTQGTGRASQQKRPAATSPSQRTPRPRTGKARKVIDDDDGDDDDIEDAPVAIIEDDSDDDAKDPDAAQDVIEDSDDDDGDDDVIEESPQPSRAKKAAAGRSGARGAGRGARAARGGRGRGRAEKSQADDPSPPPASATNSAGQTAAEYIDSDEETKTTQRRVPSFLRAGSNSSKGSQGKWGSARS